MAAMAEMTSWGIAGSVLLVLILGFTGARLIYWTVAGALMLWLFNASLPWWVAYGVLAVIFNLPLLRQRLVTSWVMGLMKPMMPKISETERVALEAGVVWVMAAI